MVASAVEGVLNGLVDGRLEGGDHHVDALVVDLEFAHSGEVFGSVYFLLLHARGGVVGGGTAAPAVANSFAVNICGLVEVTATIDCFPSHRFFVCYI